MSDAIAPQSKKMSLTETMTNSFVGFFINQTAQILIFPVVGIHVPYSVNFELAIFFTFVSVARGFCLRRYFQWRQRRLFKTGGTHANV